MECTHDFYRCGVAHASAFASNSAGAAGITQDNGRNGNFLLKWKPSPFEVSISLHLTGIYWAQSTAPGAHHVVREGERHIRSCQSHSSLVDPFNGKECIPGHLKTVDCQSAICISPWNVSWWLHWNVSVSWIYEHSQYCEENKKATLETPSFVGTRMCQVLPSGPEWNSSPTCPPGLVEEPHLGKWCRAPALLPHPFYLVCLAYLTWRR